MSSVRAFLKLHKTAVYIDWAIVVLCVLSGLLHPSPQMYYDSLVRIFIIITVPLFTFAFLIFRFSEKYGNRIQGERNKIPPLLEEAFGSARAMFVVACMAAWPTGMYRMGLPTGLAWTLEEMGLNWWLVILEMYAGIIAVDALTYWKHRLLHTKTFFPFHKHHHTFRDPTPLAFSVYSSVLSFSLVLVTTIFPKLIPKADILKVYCCP